jgi:hypothetical protein
MSDPAQGPGDEIAAPKAGEIVFYDRHEPPLMAGGYSFDIQHHVTLPDRDAQGAAVTVTESFPPDKPRSYRFFVRSERLRLDPGELQGVFPPRDSQGEYDNVFPHVVFARATLPWQRSVMADGGDAGGASWLALLSFDDLPAAPAPKAQQVSMLDLTRGAGSSLPAATGSYADAAAGDYAAQVGESLADPCLAIDLPVEVFAAVAPSLEDLRWLAHVRTTSQARKSGADQGAASNAVLVCARLASRQFATPGTRPAATVVHLVSLEHMAGWLPTDRTYAPRQIMAGGRPATHVRLVSLASWSFTSLDPSVSFTGYMTALRRDALRRPPTPGPAAGPVASALAMGYAALSHSLRLGDRAVSWFRGPLTPYDTRAGVTAGATRPFLMDADHALALDPQTRMLDASGAAAWQLGRLLMLGARDTALALAGYRQSVARSAMAAHLSNRAQPTVAHALAATGLIAAAGRPGAGPTPLHARAAALVAAIRAGPSPAAGAQASVASPTAAPAPRGAGRVQAFAAMAGARADPTLMAQAHADTPTPQIVLDTLADLAVLKRAPLAWLVPDPEALPIESIRFFHLDLDWISALLDGACAVGRSSSAHADVDSAGMASLRDTAMTQAGVAGGASGFLLRSAAVGVWPTMEFDAYLDPDAAAPDAEVIRHEIVAPDLMLFLAKGTLARVDIHEPSEGLHFGVSSTDHTKKPLRDRLGKTTGAAADVTYRDGGAAQMATLAADVSKALGRSVSNAELAFELVEGVQSFRFDVRPAGAAR